MSSAFVREDSQGTYRFSSNRDIIFESDRDQDGSGDLVFRTGGVERARITFAGSVSIVGGFSALGDITITSDSDANGAGDVIFMVGATEAGRIPVATPGGLLFGNDHSSNYGPNTGTPAGNVIPIKMQHIIGTAGVTVKQTTQAFVGWAKYKERTVDDSAEAASWGIILTDAFGGFASPQTLPVVAFEADALVQGAVSVTNKVIGATATVKIQNTAHADSTMNFYSAQTQVAGTITSRYGYYDEGVTGAGTITNNWSFYGKENIQTEKSLYVGVSGSQTSNLAVAMVTGPNVTGGAADIPSMILRPGAGQTTPALVVQTNGGLARIQMFGATGNIQLGSGATAGSGQGLLSMVTGTAPSGTPPTAGAYLYVDPADNKLKAKTSGGTVTVLTPTA